MSFHIYCSNEPTFTRAQETSKQKNSQWSNLIPEHAQFCSYKMLSKAKSLPSAVNLVQHMENYSTISRTHIPDEPVHYSNKQLHDTTRTILTIQPCCAPSGGTARTPVKWRLSCYVIMPPCLDVDDGSLEV